MAPGKADTPYDIRERSFLFGVRVIKWVRTLPRDWATETCAKQLIRAATSVGANIEEADGTETIKDKVYKWTTSRKEARESRFWVRTICAANSESPEGQALIQESSELTNILSTLIKKNKDTLNSD
ncbi:MAG: four helix bundle protein [Chloroflexi bacterium]|nr:four helix bundle protein [Chloroflexota bacterium]